MSVSSEGALTGSPAISRLGGDPPSPWEELFGFSRIVQAGSLVVISGTTAIDPAGVVVGSTPYEQAVEIFSKLRRELQRLGLELDSVIQTRMYVTDISRSGEVGRAHAQAFGAVRPAATMVEVSALIDPRMLVEVELLALRPS
ncbi:MAG: RidA family protein [Solirubrobacteraceae bacterium]